MVKLYHGNCLELMKDIPDNSIDLILCDPPYGQTPLEWDSVLSFEKMWEQYSRISKSTTPVLIFGQEPFSSMVRLSNLDWYKYDWYWEKERLTNLFQVKRRPGKTVESISVFYKKQCKYFPQKSEHLGKLVTNKIGENARFSETQTGKSLIKPLEYFDDGTRYPTQVLRFTRDNPRNRLHPTQKPIALLEYLISTYTNENDLVLDNCMGSGSTGVACLNTKRNFIGIELDDNYFDIAKNRIEEREKEIKSSLW